MGTIDYKKMKRKDWLELAESFGIEHYPKSTIRYFVEKIAEKIGVDDKIVKTDDLKKAVADFLNSKEDEGTSEEVVVDEKSESVEEVNDSVNDTSESDENENSESSEEVVENEETADSNDENSESNKSKLELLREKATSMGIAWSEVHKEIDLEMIIQSVEKHGKGANYQEPFKPNEVIKKESDTDKVNDIKCSKANLIVYRDIINNTVKNHFRPLSLSEMNDLLNSPNFPFDFEINHNSENKNKIQITLKINEAKLLVPSDNKNEWIEIGG